nr:unnamed protein product [Callosobruchus analis]
MLSSVFSKNEDSSEMLKKMTLDIIKILTDVGYTIVSLICDNHRMNQGMTVKLAPALYQKILHPSTLERQNVSLAVRLFGEKNNAALNIIQKDNIGTAEFLKIILSWWKIVHVRSSKAGINLKDPLREPLTSPDYDSIKFLRKYIQFLNAWGKLDVPQYCPGHTGKLTKDTFTSLKYTSAAFIDLVDYLFTVNLNLHFELKYVLLWKFQTDKMKVRFWRYRF